MFPRSYLHEVLSIFTKSYLSSRGPMFPSLHVAEVNVPEVIYSRVPIFWMSYVAEVIYIPEVRCSRGPMFPRSYVLEVLCSRGPVFPRSYVPDVCDRFNHN